MTTTDLTIVPIETPTLGDRSYVVHDGNLAFVVDPQRDIDRVLVILDEHDVRLTDVFETHIHNDYLTDGLALAQRTGAAYHVNADDQVSFERTSDADDRDRHPGPYVHPPVLRTQRRLPDVAADGRSAGVDASVGVFSGGSLLFAATGRPDLLGEEHTDVLARQQHASAHRLACSPMKRRSSPRTASDRSARRPSRTRSSRPLAERRRPTRS